MAKLKAFLGMLSYYSKFLPDMSSTLAPLYALLQKGNKWHWGSRQQQAFVAAKRALVSNSVLVHFDPSKKLVLTCDASQYGIGALLAHVEDSSQRPIAFASRTLSPKYYSQLEKEGLAIVYGVKKFHSCLYGRRFTIHSDHQPLCHLFGSKKEIPPMVASRIQRWALTLSAYEYSIEYRAGKTLQNADALSRLPLCRKVKNQFQRTFSYYRSAGMPSHQ